MRDRRHRKIAKYVGKIAKKIHTRKGKQATR
jgi:hypothetical protein